MRLRLVFLGFLIGSIAASSRADVVGHWTLDDGLTEPDATTVVDSSPNGHDGELIDVFESPWVSGPDAQFGGAIDLEFTDGWVEIDVGNQLPIGDAPRTLTAWINLPIITGDAKFLHYGTEENGRSFDFTVELHDGTPHIWLRHWGGNIRYPGAIEDEWMHFATVVPDGAGMTSDVQVYINGEESIGVRGAGEDRVMDTGESFLIIGARNGGANPFAGKVDDVWLFDEALDQAAIQAIMAGGDLGMTRLEAGDADQDLDFDQVDLVRVQISAKYLTGQDATWGEGDWDGAPGGEPGNPPAGNGLFDQLDIIAALGAGKYLTGPYGAVFAEGRRDDGQTSIVYDANTGELAVDAPVATELTSINIDSAAGIFTGEASANLGGSFDNDADANIFKATFGSSFGSLSFGNVAQLGLSEEFVLGDLTVIGSLAGGGNLATVDLIYVPEPASVLLMFVGLVIALVHSRCANRRK